MRSHALSIGVAAVLLAACGPDGGERPAPPTPPSPRDGGTPGTPSPEPEETFDPEAVEVDLEVVVRGLESPLAVVPAADGSGRLFVVEQIGRIRVVEDGELLGDPFLDISDRVTAGGEQGLLGLALHPDFGDNGRLFVNYTDTGSDTVIAEFRAEPPGGDVADPDSERVLLTYEQPFANHNGGAVQFGPDGFLYVASGDGGSGGDPMDNGQRLDTLLGKILRIDVDARDAGEYGIPRDNPFRRRSGARPEIWSYGLRNPWRFTFDRETDAMWIGDVGQGELEEIDREPPGAGGRNYGWNVLEGTQCFEPPEGCDRRRTARPVAVYPTSMGCAVVGGYAYRGERFPSLRGAYLFADYCAGTVFAIAADGPREQEPVIVGETGRSISSFGEDPNGELYVTDLSAGDVLRVVAS